MNKFELKKEKYWTPDLSPYDNTWLIMLFHTSLRRLLKSARRCQTTRSCFWLIILRKGASKHKHRFLDIDDDFKKY